MFFLGVYKPLTQSELEFLKEITWNLNNYAPFYKINLMLGEFSMTTEILNLNVLQIVCNTDNILANQNGCLGCPKHLKLGYQITLSEFQLSWNLVALKDFQEKNVYRSYKKLMWLP